MEYTIAFDAPAEKIYQDFTSPEYWQTLMDSYLEPRVSEPRFLQADIKYVLVLRRPIPRRGSGRLTPITLSIAL